MRNQSESKKFLIYIILFIPLIFVGKISDMITQGIGPKEAAKQATKPRMKINSHGPELTS